MRTSASVYHPQSIMEQRTKVFFTSDAHLGSAYHKDPRAVEQRLVRWLQTIQSEARAVYFLGDMFDYWFEYRAVVPRGYVRFLGQVAMMHDQGVEIHFFAGNHDVWFRDYLKEEVGAIIHHHAEVVELMGKTFRLAHGDEEYCVQKFSNKFLYKLFRNRIAQVLYAAVHPRWTVGFALSCSLRSRKRGMARRTLGNIPHAYENDYFNVEQELLVRFAKKHSIEYPEIDYYLFGHRHLLIDLALKANKRVIVLGDWLQYNSFAVWDGEHLYIDQFEVE